MKKVQIGRSRMAEELARPTWDAGKKEKTDTVVKKKHESDTGKSEESGKGRSGKRGNNRQVEKIAAVLPEDKILWVAAYARVSTDLDSQETSIENQQDHYRRFIENHVGWELAGIYAESGVSGTKSDSRSELQRLLKDCREGKIDVVITKSISRFARNTSECLSMVRELSALGITLIFEKENIDTSKMESEFLMTLLAAFAESESQSISTNQKWAIRKRFQSGTYKGGKVPYGYRKCKGGYVIESEEAAIVRRIFVSLCEGKGTVVIARELNAEKIPTWTESYRNEEGKGKWRSVSINAIARNEFYTGDFLYQKYFTDEHYIRHKNEGQLDMYINEGDHPAIIDHHTFERASEAIAKRGEAYGQAKRKVKRYALSGKLLCGCCGGHMSRGKDTKPFYACGNHTHKRTVTVDGEDTICTMLPVFEADILTAFTSTLNRLATFPALLETCGLDTQDVERERLNTQLQSIRRKKNALHDRALADRYTAELREKKATLDAEEKEIMNLLARLEKKSPVADLRKVVTKRGVRDVTTPADEDLFTAFVDHAVLYSKEKAQFHFTCGLVVEEDMRVQKVGRSYTEVPVRTEFDEQKGAFTWQ